MSIYSRLKNAVKEQNWFAVVLEMIIVMGSLLLAFQIDRWYEANQERKREADYLQRLKENLEVDKNNIDDRIEFFQDVQAYGELAISHYEKRSDPDLDNWDILVGYFQASQIWPIVLSSDTYDELKSAGELDLLRDVELRQRLAQYYGDQYSNYENSAGIMPVYRERIRGQIPFELQNAVWDNCHRSNEIANTQFLVECDQPAEISDADIDAAIKNIEDGDYINDLRFWMSNLRVGIDILGNQGGLGVMLMEHITTLQGGS